MKTLNVFLIALASAALTACGNRDTNNEQSADTMMTDSAVMDTTPMSSTPADTTVQMADSTATGSSTGTGQ